MSNEIIARRRLRIDTYALSDRAAEKYGFGDEGMLTLQDMFPHLRAQRFTTAAGAGEQFVEERAFGDALRGIFATRPIEINRAMDIERGMFVGVALLQAVDTYGTVALDTKARHGWRITRNMAPRTERIMNLVPMLAPLMVILGQVWQHEVRRSRASAKPGKIIRGREMMNFIVESLALTGWPFREVDVRAEKAGLYAALGAELGA